MKEDTKHKKIEKVVNGPVKVKKKNEISKLRDAFISEDASNAKSYIVEEVLIPAIVKTVREMIVNGFDMVFGKGYSRGSRSTRADDISYVPYNDRFKKDDRYHTPEARTRYSYNDITIPSRGEAEEVLMRMDEIIAEYDAVSIADYYELVGYDGGRYTDQNYGWTSLRTAEVVRAFGGGYTIKLPRATPLK